MDIGKTLYTPERKAWRAWLQKHAATELEIWLIFYTKASGQPTLPYNDAVEEALCFGWIDSTVKKHGPDSRAQRFTPRRKGSQLSPMNRERMLRLIDQGLMTQAGLDAVEGMLHVEFELPPDIEAALRADPETWANYEAFPASYKRIRVGFVDGSRNRQEAFNQRLAYFLKMTKLNKRFGMVQ